MPALQPEVNKIVPPMVVSGTLVEAMSVESRSTPEALVFNAAVIDFNKFKVIDERPF
jgi:hypothetical protein